MQKNILIIGGKGLVGKTIYRILKSRNPDAHLFVGSRKTAVEDNDLTIDVNQPGTFQSILDKKIDLIVLSVNDNEDNVLHFAVKHRLDYIDITKPTPALMKAYHAVVDNDINSRIVFSSGWMGGIVSGLVKAHIPNDTDIEKVDLFVYYSVKDLAGESSAYFMAENVATPFVRYEDNKPVHITHFLDTDYFEFGFGIGRRQVYNFDVPDLYILHKIEHIPNVSVKMTYNSKFITWLLGAMQRFGIFKRLSLKSRRKVFSSSGNGDLSVFDVVIYARDGKQKKISVLSEKGQAELTALSTVLHIESLFNTHVENRIYFAHELHTKQDLHHLLVDYKTITVNVI